MSEAPEFVRQMLVVACRLEVDGKWHPGPAGVEITVTKKDFPVLEYKFRGADGVEHERFLTVGIGKPK